MATINGTAGNDTLIGNGDGFYGNEGTDTINGLGGDDSIDGRGGADSLNGGDGNDTFVVTVLDNKLSSYDGGAGYDTLSFAGTNQRLVQDYFGHTAGLLQIANTGATGGLSGRMELFQGQLQGIERLVLGNGDDALTYPDDLTYVDGGAGNDSLQNGFNSAHQVTLNGGAGNDYIAGYYNDVLLGGVGDDVISIGTGQGSFGGTFPGTYTTTVDGGAGTDTLNSDAQMLDMRTGMFTLGQITVTFTGIENVGVGAQSTVYGDDGPNRISGATIQPGQTVTRGEIFFGNGGDDVLTGSSIGDYLDGGAGNDTLDGNSGINTLIGGAGIDTAIIHSTFANAQILFQPGHVDIKAPDGSIQQNYGIESFQFNDRLINNADGKPLVDDLFYYYNNPDVASALVEAEDHYAASGWHEGRDPNAYFSTTGYLNANPDVKAAGLNPLQHYDTVGWKEGRDASLNFDTTLYLLHNPDVAAAGIDPLAHYLQFGQAEGRQAYAAIGTRIYANGFDAEYYLMANPDVATVAAASGGNVDDFAYRHYETVGWKEGRNPNAYFDDQGYLAAYKDVAAAGVNPLDHYATSGWHEGRDPSANFDTSDYLAAYADVAQVGIDPLNHYLGFGAYESRSSFGDGFFS